MLTSNDFTKGLDFTGLGGSATAGDHNNLVDQASPVFDSISEGKGINIWSIDSALDTPIVPDAATTTKWKRYLWIRILHSTATTHIPYVYAWDDNNASIATYLKWRRVEADLTAINATIVIVQADVANALVTANAAQATANAANTVANTAATDATTALNSAASAAANATTALANAATAIANAATALATAQAAQAAAAVAQATATQAAAAVVNVSYTKHVTAAIAMTSGPAYGAGATLIDELHGHAGKPQFARAVAVCTTNDGDYVVGDEVDILAVNSNQMNTFSLKADATKITLSFYRNYADPDFASGVNKAGALFNFAKANWSVKVYTIYFP